jgi:hypothetical protein
MYIVYQVLKSENKNITITHLKNLSTIWLYSKVRDIADKSLW